MKLSTGISMIALAAMFTLSSLAAEKNGFIATVGKKTIDRDSSTGYYVKTDKTQGLVLDVKNNSIKEFPEGEVIWTIVVRRSYEERNEKFSGKEKLKALKSSQAAQLVIGSAQVTDYKTGYSNYKDKLEYDVVIMHEGKETIRLTSTPGFEALAKRAVVPRNTASDDDERPVKREVEPKDDGKTVIKGGSVKPAPATPAVKPAPATPSVRPAPATPAVKPASDKPATPPKGDSDKPAEEEKPFDFFNLDKKKKTEPAEK